MVCAMDLNELEKRIGYEFKDEGLLTHAMTHSSYANEHGMEKSGSNERLEFLGDAVLELVSSEFLYHNYPNLPEGDMSKLRASLVCEPTLARCTDEIELPKYLLLSRGEDATGGRGRDSIVSDAMEALIGAIFLDGGMEPAKAFILKYILTDIESKRLFYDSKTTLQEVVQAEGGEKLSYEVVGESGPDHAKTFTVEVRRGGETLGRGEGHSKKAAEQKAAYEALLAMHRLGDLKLI